MKRVNSWLEWPMVNRPGLVGADATSGLGKESECVRGPLIICFSRSVRSIITASYHIVLKEPSMEMILLDWTRMGKWYCLAGVVEQGGTFRVVRPLLAKFRAAPVRNVGWSAYLLDGHARWEIFELIAP